MVDAHDASADANHETSTEAEAPVVETTVIDQGQAAQAEPEQPVASDGAPEPGHEPGLEGPAEVRLPEPDEDALPFAVQFFAPDIASLPPLPALPTQRRDDEDDEDDDEPRAGRRRRRGRGRGESDAPRAERPLITEPQKVQGSTRLEAKKQRRREGRDAGRRRAVVTESEFLARRESVERTMVVRSRHDRVQLAVLEDGILVEHYVAKSSETSLIGNVYLGKVQNVLPSMEAAFVDIGRGRNAVLYSGEIDWEAAGLENQPRKIELALKPGDTVLVQVTKDPIGHKGARLTSQISLPGRYLVSVPGGSMSGISRKLPDTERARLKKILKEVLPEGMGVIVRTAAEGATQEQLTRDVERLGRQWQSIQDQAARGSAPARLHAEPDLLVKIVRDVFNEDFQRMVIQGDEALATIREYLGAIAPDLLERIEPYELDVDPFEHFRVSEQIDKALDRKVWLPSGGSLVIDRTEAMTVIDVNTGRFVGQGGNLEETVTKNNLEAAEEVVRQLRLRDIGGIVVIDFIDMVLESNRDLVQRRLIECLSRDRTKHQVAEVTSLGLVQMTRKRLGLGLLEAYSETCEVCAGRGLIVHHEPVSKSSRAGNGAAEGGRRRGGKRQESNGGGGSGQQQHSQQQGTHAITDDARKGLSQMAAATKGRDHAHDDEHAHEAPADDVQQQQTQQAPEQRQPAREQSSRRGRRASSRGVDRDAQAPASAPAPEQAAVTILDIPVAARRDEQVEPAQRPRDVEGLLSGALDALAAPAAGTGKAARRSRRASSGGIVTAKPDED
ncbi:Rne/Rng family ribonuclease [Agrococcus sp. SGAir0287]|uniref:Rne/Rng family ribonuclease n=1 Tax=Agrococcus sp. SGAir0287 TaxID=2070347 RepID=UPI0010CD206B|nr:Rne/Rng family ribonuclease [Agrococcus sp. SGAir0287]QCR19086.1 ribonuclease E/G [Agrococcus sp. SGAir0287]